MCQCRYYWGKEWGGGLLDWKANVEQYSYSAVAVRLAGGLGSESVATIVGIAQGQGEPRLNRRYRSYCNTGDNSLRYGVRGSATPREREKGVQVEDLWCATVHACGRIDPEENTNCSAIPHAGMGPGMD
jgi:hypothetical protein